LAPSRSCRISSGCWCPNKVCDNRVHHNNMTFLVSSHCCTLLSSFHPLALYYIYQHIVSPST
jgi:hypothetical protein